MRPWELKRSVGIIGVSVIAFFLRSMRRDTRLKGFGLVRCARRFLTQIAHSRTRQLPSRSLRCAFPARSARSRKVGSRLLANRGETLPPRRAERTDRFYPRRREMEAGARENT